MRTQRLLTVIAHLRKSASPLVFFVSGKTLAGILGFTAGAVNAGGFMAVRQYTSHMSGIASAMADNLVLGKIHIVLGGVIAILSFLAGPASTAMMVRWSRRSGLECGYALPLTVEAVMLMIFGITGRVFGGHSVTSTVAPLCFTMGVQNAIVTKIEGTVVRTTHITGMVTDLGIKVGGIVYALSTGTAIASSIEVGKLKLLVSLVALFLLGGVTGAWGFDVQGFLFTLPLSLILLALAATSLLGDIRHRRKPADHRATI